MMKSALAEGISDDIYRVVRKVVRRGPIADHRCVILVFLKERAQYAARTSAESRRAQTSLATAINLVRTGSLS